MFHRFIFSLVFSFLSLISYSEYQYFRIFDTKQSNLLNDFVYALEQDTNGVLLVSTGEGLSLFDGINFHPVPGDSVLERDIINIFYRPGRDQKFFLGSTRGVLYLYDNYQITKLKALFDVTSQILDFTNDRKGNIFYLTQRDGVVRVNESDHTQEQFIENLESYRVTGLSYLKDSVVLIATDEGMITYNYYTAQVSLFEDLPLEHYTFLKRRTQALGFITGSDKGHLYFMNELEDGEIEIEDMTNYLDNPWLAIEDVLEDRSGNLWIASFGDGIYKIPFYQDVYQEAIEVSSEQGFPGDFIKQIFEDLEGNIWVATYGYGLVNIDNRAFNYHSINAREDPVTTLLINDTLEIIGSGQTLYLNQKPITFPSTVISLELMHNKLLVGTRNDGLFEYDLHRNVKRQVFVKRNSLSNQINSIKVKEGTIYLATFFGVYVLDTQYAVQSHITTNNGLLHNAVNDLLVTQGASVLAATKSKGLYNISRQQNIELSSFHNTDFVSIAEDSKGGIWIATSGDGVLHYIGDQVNHYTVNHGLKSNYCYGILVDSKDRVWISFREGLSKIYLTRQISSYGKSEGVDAIFIPTSQFQYNDVLYYGTTKGYVSYDLRNEVQTAVTPKLSIRYLEINGELYRYSDKIILPFGQYDIKIAYFGILLRDPQSVSYSHKMDNYDADWSSLSMVNHAAYKRMTKGSYSFNLRAITHDGQQAELTDIIYIEIKKPFWEELWFILIAVLLLVALVYFIIKFRERKQRQKEIELKALLDERTKEVVEQKEEIELKNKDITDSINYAWRIQSGLMPSTELLRTHFQDMFVFYQPKDIVSGDFYWFTELDNGKFFVACADCTGHGVPGSMVSMIGITLLKDICKRDVDATPAEKLMILDQEFEKTLNQNQRKEASNDGMDIIICEFDKDMKEFVFSSAMRPLWIYKNKEMIKYRGNNSSIGGYRFFEAEDKHFEDQHVQIQKDDVVYLFSDGFVDQFGGPNNKKYRSMRLLELLQRYGHYTMLDQLLAIENDFIEWKGGYFQIDDVLLMGLKV